MASSNDSNHDALTNDEILSLSFNELRSECRNAKIPSGGNTQALRKRLREWSSAQGSNDDEDSQGRTTNQNNNDASNKRQKKSPADNLICAITLSLPWEPVTAADGCLYEKAAIEQHIKNHQGGVLQLRSPVTNVPMAPRLLPAPHI